MLLLQQVLIDSNTEIGSGCLISDMRYRIVCMTRLAITKFCNREPLIMKIDAQGALVLTIIRQFHHRQACQIKGYGKSAEKRNRVLL